MHIANKNEFNHKEFYSYMRNSKVFAINIGPIPLENGKVTNTEFVNG